MLSPYGVQSIWRLHVAFLTLALMCSKPLADENWNQFRGPRGDGVCAAKDLPIKFDEASNVRWKTAVPDSGWSSPVIWEDEIWLTTGSDDKKELRAICIDLETGRITHDIKVFGMIERKIDATYKADSPHLNSPASPTPVVEADRLFVSFGSQGIACLDRQSGEKLWERRDLRIYQPVRQGSSPIVDEQNLYVAFDGNFEQYFVALDKTSGETRWKKDRNVGTDWEATLKRSGFSKGVADEKPGDNKKSFATATLMETGGQRQLIAPAAEATISYDPDSGEELWRVLYPGGFNVAARPIYANGLIYVFTSGLREQLMAIKPHGSGDVTETHIAWSTTRSTPVIPSPIVIQDLLFMVTDKGGIARCLDAKTGEEFWKVRLGGDHWASPLYADEKVYFSSKQGDVTVVEASRSEPKILARNKLNAEFIASPAVARDSLILRSTTHLYCIAKGYQRSAEQVAADVYPRRTIRQGDSRRTSKTTDTKQGNRKDLNQVDLEALGQRLKAAVRSGEMTEADAIAKYKAAAEQAGKNGAKRKDKGASGKTNFYAVVIGRLRSKDIELGELTIQVDHVSSMYGNRWVKDKIVGKTVRVTGVSGKFLDNLLQIKRGDTLKVRTGSYIDESKTLTFGHKFHVLERTAPFKPEDFGVPPNDFRGFQGELTGKIIEASGYEVLLEVSQQTAADNSRAEYPASILGKRVRIVGFYGQHSEAFADLREGDEIRVGVLHANPEHDELNVTDVLERVEK